MTQTVTLVLSSFPGGAGDVWFSLKGITYQNNSIVTLEDIGEGDDALLCITDVTDCCRSVDVGESVLGNWFFPNETRVPSSGRMWEFHRTRGASVVRMHRARGGAEGLYRCEIPNTPNITQSIYIGVYSKGNGKPLLTNYSGTSENGLPLLRKPPQCGQESAVPNYSPYYSICT